jgi:organic hydroperoxide reductase OsmC/OhrA
MRITAQIVNKAGDHQVSVETNLNSQYLAIPPKASGQGSAVNGGEMLFLAIATCFCNDIYREALRRNMKIDSVEVRVSGDFGSEGEPATNIEYSVNIIAPDHTLTELDELIQYVDRIAEVHNTIRRGTPIILTS